MEKDLQPGSDSAIALFYDGDKAPIITAKGDDSLAQQIIQIAAEHGVYVHQDPMLTHALSYLELGDEIPKELYISIARVIAFAYYLDDKTPWEIHKVT